MSFPGKLSHPKSKNGTIHGYTPAEFFEKCKEIILNENRYLTKNEISKLVGVPRTTILSAGVDTDAICKKLGFERTRLNPKDGGVSRVNLIRDITEKYVAYLKDKNKSCSFYEFLKTLNLTDSQLSKYYRYSIDVKECHLKAGVTFIENYGTDYENAEKVLREMIVSKNRYITTTELALQLGKSNSVFLKNYSCGGMDVLSINHEYGFSPNLGGFENRIWEYLVEIFPEHTIHRQKSFDNLISGKDGRSKLRFDFFISELNLLVEADGPSHWDPDYVYYSDEVAKRDILKEKYALDNNYVLLRLKWRNKFTKDDLVNALSGIPLKPSVGQPAAKPEKIQEGSETIRKE